MSKTLEELTAERDAANADRTKVRERIAAAHAEEEAAMKEWREADRVWRSAASEVRLFGRCHAEIWDNWTTSRCSRKNGYGRDGDYCKQHAKKHPAEAEATK
jgi:hypothetical protein